MELSFQEEAQPHCDIFPQSGAEMIDSTNNKRFQEGNPILRKQLVGRDFDAGIQARSFGKFSV